MALTDKLLNSLSTVAEAIAVLEGHYKDSLKGDIPFTLELLRVINTEVAAASSDVDTIQGILDGPASATVTWVAGTGTDDADITVEFLKSDGTVYAGVVAFDFWISEANTGAGVTGDTYSGDVTVTTGTEVQEIISKKYFRVLTDESGSAVINAVASANPTDQYACIALPIDGSVIVSNVSGTGWEGA